MIKASLKIFLIALMLSLNIEASVIKISKPTKHSVNQKINRNVKSLDEFNALKKPLKINPVNKDISGRASQRYVGEKAEVAINPDTNNIVSVNPTSSKKAERLKRQENDKN